MAQYTPALPPSGDGESIVKVNIRKSALIHTKRHGFRAKPKSHMPRGKKIKNIKLMIKGRRKRRIRAKA
jgi:hypothetical protein